jgi:hypothetical protein
MLANYTYADGELADGGELLNSSKNTWNLTGYLRERALQRAPGLQLPLGLQGGRGPRRQPARGRHAFAGGSVNVKLTEQLTLTFDALNLTNETSRCTPRTRTVRAPSTRTAAPSTSACAASSDRAVVSAAVHARWPGHLGVPVQPGRRAGVLRQAGAAQRFGASHRPGLVGVLQYLPAAVAASVDAGYAIEHLNGDLFRLRASGGAAWLPGEALEVRYQARFWAISITDAPLGFYLIEADGKVSDLGDPEILPFARPEQLQRNLRDQLPPLDAARRWQDNDGLRLLPRREVGRITPKPLSARFTDSVCALSGDSEIVAAEGLENEAAFLRALIRGLPRRADAARIVLDTGLADGAEAYHLDIDPGSVRIRGGSRPRRVQRHPDPGPADRRRRRGAGRPGERCAALRLPRHDARRRAPLLGARHGAAPARLHGAATN